MRPRYDVDPSVWCCRTRAQVAAEADTTVWALDPTTPRGCGPTLRTTPPDNPSPPTPAPAWAPPPSRSSSPRTGTSAATCLYIIYKGGRKVIFLRMSGERRRDLKEESHILMKTIRFTNVILFNN
jgi:hypothetical protein